MVDSKQIIKVKVRMNSWERMVREFEEILNFKLINVWRKRTGNTKIGILKSQITFLNLPKNNKNCL